MSAILSIVVGLLVIVIVCLGIGVIRLARELADTEADRDYLPREAKRLRKRLKTIQEAMGEPSE